MNKNQLLQFLHFHPESSRTEIEAALELEVSSATLKRMLANLSAFKQIFLDQYKFAVESYF